MKQGYAFQGYEKSKMARALGVSLPISPKESYELSNLLRHKSLETAKAILNRVLEKKQAIPYKRYNADVAHKPGMSSGRYPRNLSREILKLLESVEKNANAKGLTNDLYIVHMNAHKAVSSPRGGRVAGEGKRAHVEIVVEERKIIKKERKIRKSQENQGKSK